MKQILKTIILFVLSLVLYLSIPSCVKDDINLSNVSDSVDWHPGLDMPVAHGSISLKDIIESVDEQGIIKEDKNGLLYILYNDTIFSQTAKDLLPIPSQQFSQALSAGGMGIPGGLGYDSVKFSQETFYDFSLSKTDAQLNYMNLKSGILSINTNINFPYPCRITVVFPTLTKNGIPFSYTFRSSGTAQINLSGYKLTFETNGGAPNKVRVKYDACVTNSNNAISPLSSISINAGITSAGFSSIYGYLGQMEVLNRTNQKITLDMFDNSKDNLNVEFEQPKVSAFIRNSFGLPVRVTVNNVKTYSEKTSSYFTVNFNPSQIDIKYPTVAGSSAFDTVAIQSNFFEAVKTSPHYLYYDVKAEANPGGVAGVNFFTDTSRLNVGMELNLPLKFKATNLTFYDTIHFDNELDKELNLDRVKSLVLKSTFTNSIPFDLNVQVFLADANMNIVDQVFDATSQPIIRSGVLNSSTGKYEFSSPVTIPVSFDEQRIQKIKSATSAIVKFTLTTAGNGQNLVPFYSNYLIKVAFQAQTKLQVNSLNQF